MSEPENTNAEYGLIVAFPDDSASFVRGFEAGGIWARMRVGNTYELVETTHVENREVLARMAIADGWEIEVKPSGVEGWDSTTLTKSRKTPTRPNPRGFHVVDRRIRTPSGEPMPFEKWSRWP